MLLPACADLSGLRDQFAEPCGPDGCAIVATCSQLNASQLNWTLSGFTSQDILNPDERNQPQLTAIMHVGDDKTLKLRATYFQTTEDCTGKATSIAWSVSNPVVARLDVAEDPRTGSLVALEAGDTDVAATLTFQDGTPPMRVLPWSFTNVGSGDVTVVRVVP
jgi:hypothetical protein